MPRKTSLEYSDQPSKLLKRATLHVRGGLVASAQLWHRKYFHRHFEPSAVSRYGYTPRTKKYQLRKAKQMRHQKPLLWSGSARAAMKHNVTFRARKVRGGDELEGMAVMRPPKYWYYHPNTKASGRFIDKSAELTTTTLDEQDAAVELIRRRLIRRMGGEVERKVIKFG